MSDATVTDAPAIEWPARALFNGPMELRDATQEGTLGTLVGYLAVFNEWTEIDSAIEGHFLERVALGAFKKTFAEGRNRIRCIFHHGNDASVGVRVLGPVSVLEERDDGAYAEVPLLDTSYNRDLAPGIAAGLYGMSFRFKALRQDIDRSPRRSDYNPNRLPERTLTELRVPEFGPTPFQAYDGAQAGMRSITDDIAVEALAARGHMWTPEARPRIVLPDTTDNTANNRTEGAVRASTGTALASEGGSTTTRVVGARLYERAVRFAVTHPWAMEPQALAVVLGILQERAAGEWPSEAELRARLGMKPVAAAADTTVTINEDDMADDTANDTDPVAVIQVFGPIVPHAGMVTMTSSEMASAEGLMTRFRAAEADSAVEHIVFNFDSPGGNVGLIPELAAEILAGKKPTTAVANTLMASAAYWIASACDEIVASPSADVGSIGVYSAHQDLTKAMDDAGVRITLTQSDGSPYKTEFSPFVELTDEAQAEMLRRNNAIMDDFVGAVAQGRGTTTEDVLANYGQGRCLMAAEALAVGMVDRIGTLDSVLDQLHSGAAAPASDGAEENDEEDGEPELGAAAAAIVAPHPAPARRGIDPHTLKPKEDPEWLL